MVEYYDSLVHHGGIAEINLVLDHFASKLSAIDPLENFPYKYERKITTTLQLDGYQCVPWAIYFSEHLLENPNVDFNSLSDPSKVVADYRQTLQNRLNEQLSKVCQKGYGFFYSTHRTQTKLKTVLCSYNQFYPAYRDQQPHKIAFQKIDRSLFNTLLHDLYEKNLVNNSTLIWDNRLLLTENTFEYLKYFVISPRSITELFYEQGGFTNYERLYIPYERTSPKKHSLLVVNRTNHILECYDEENTFTPTEKTQLIESFNNIEPGANWSLQFKGNQTSTNEENPFLRILFTIETLLQNPKTDFNTLEEKTLESYQQELFSRKDQEFSTIFSTGTGLIGKLPIRNNEFKCFSYHPRCIRIYCPPS